MPPVPNFPLIQINSGYNGFNFCSDSERFQNRYRQLLWNRSESELKIKISLKLFWISFDVLWALGTANSFWLPLSVELFNDLFCIRASCRYPGRKICNKCAEMSWVFKIFRAITLYKKRWNVLKRAENHSIFKKKNALTETPAVAITQSTAPLIPESIPFNLIPY